MIAVRFLHLLGMVLFVGGGLAAWLANRAAQQAKESVAARALDDLQRLASRITNWGGFVAVASGAGAIRVFRYDGPGMPKETWLMVMLIAGVAAMAIAGMAGARTRRLVELPDDAIRAEARAALGGLRAAFLAACLVALVSGAWRFKL
jgi:uncharacterized membrane protein